MIFECLVGLLFSVSIIFFGYIKNLSLRGYYGITLICLPLIYVGFGLFADGTGVIQQEFLYGLPFIAMGIICAVTELKYSGYLVALFWFSHAAYDLFHQKLFINSGVPSWYPVVCAAIDLSVGLWIIYWMLTEPEAQSNPVS